MWLQIRDPGLRGSLGELTHSSRERAEPQRDAPALKHVYISGKIRPGNWEACLGHRRWTPGLTEPLKGSVYIPKVIMRAQGPFSPPPGAKVFLFLLGKGGRAPVLYLMPTLKCVYVGRWAQFS